MFNKFPKRSGIYRILDNIEQLQLRLHFRHINSLLKLPKFDLHKLAADDWRQHGTDNNDSDTDDADAVQTINIKWQQKILSAHEIEYYKDASNCVTERQKNYHAWLLAGGSAQLADPALLQNDDKPKSKKRARKKQQLKPQIAEEINHVEHIFTYINEDNHEPAEAACSQHTKQPHLFATTAVMFVYATLQSVDTLLIALRWFDDEHLLHIYPDFNCFHECPYYIQVDANYSHLYAYGFENYSPSQVVDGLLSSSSNLLQLPQVPHWQSEQQLDLEFAMPPKRYRRIVLLLEIREARDFEYENLHVRYHVILPTGALLEEGLLQASTQASAAMRGMHYFGHCCQLTLVCEECENLGGLCHIFFEVISIDGWQRERVEGFAYCAYTLHKAAVSDSQHLRCLRPVDSFLDSLNRFFIGGRQCFDYERFFLGDAEPSKPEDNSEFHSRYGCRMQRTGELVISCKLLLQRNCELLQPCMNNSSGMTLDDIMLAYREARKRLERIVL